MNRTRTLCAVRRKVTGRERKRERIVKKERGKLFFFLLEEPAQVTERLYRVWL